MSNTRIFEKISKDCLHGQPVPVCLQRLWEALDVNGDRPSWCWLELMTSLEPLDDGYGAEIAEESAETAANVWAHQRVFERLGFFAKDGDGGFLAFDLLNPAKDESIMDG